MCKEGISMAIYNRAPSGRICNPYTRSPLASSSSSVSGA